MITEQDILDTHKLSHGISRDHKNWNNPKWLDMDEWGIDFAPWYELIQKAKTEGYQYGH